MGGHLMCKLVLLLLLTIYGIWPKVGQESKKCMPQIKISVIHD